MTSLAGASPDTTLLSAGEVTTEFHGGVSAQYVLQQLLTTHSSGIETSSEGNEFS